MKFRLLILILLVAVIGRPVLPQQSEKPLTKNQILELVKTEMDNTQLAKLVRERGIDFELTDDYVQALRAAGAQDVLIAALHEAKQAKSQPLTREQVLHLVAGGVPSERTTELVELRGIDFLADEEYLNTLRQWGADDALLAAMREASARVTTELVVVTSPNAEVFLDGESQGHANAQGEFAVKAKLGAHTLKVSLAGKKDFQQSLTLTLGQAAPIEARLVDAPGSIRVRTLAGASIALDGASRGATDANGELALADVSPGTHEVQVSAPQKKAYLQHVAVTAGQETLVEARLADLSGSIRLQTLAGASVTLDGASGGSTDVNGELVLGDLSPGTHEVQVSAPKKKAYIQHVTVTAGQETRLEATLQDAPPPPPQVRENPRDGLRYVWIPPGSFQMGCSPGDNDCFAEEKPSHHVVITKGFWLGQTEVTVEAYKRFAGATARHMPRAPRFDPGWVVDRLPIVNVTWRDAHEYCAWAGGRLPTEAEWEYAARGGSTEVRYGELSDIAWSSQNSQGQAHEGAQKRANRFGLYDVLGNVAEWVNDWYEKNYYQDSPWQDPSGPTSGTVRVLRGGSWNSPPLVLRVSGRYESYPNLTNDYVGVRCGGEVFPP